MLRGDADEVPENLLPSRAGGGGCSLSKTALQLSGVTLPVGTPEVGVRPNFPWWWGLSWEVHDVKELVRPKSGIGRPGQVEEKIPDDDGNFRGRGRPVRRETGGVSSLGVQHWELWIAVSIWSPLEAAHSSSVIENQDGWWALKSPSTNMSPRSPRILAKSVA